MSFETKFKTPKLEDKPWRQHIPRIAYYVTTSFFPPSSLFHLGFTSAMGQLLQAARLSRRCTMSPSCRFLCDLVHFLRYCNVGRIFWLQQFQNLLARACTCLYCLVRRSLSVKSPGGGEKGFKGLLVTKLMDPQGQLKLRLVALYFW